MSKPIKILFVEDDEFDLYLVQRELKKSELNFTNAAVDNEKDYVEQLNSFQPDIVLSDFNLPGFSGLKAFELQQQILPNIPFIFVSGNIGEEKSIDLIKNGVTDFALKDKLFSLAPKVTRALKEFEDRESKRNTELIIEFERNNLKALINNSDGIIWSVDVNFNLITSNKAFDDYLETIRNSETSTSNNKKQNKKSQFESLLKKFNVYYRRAFRGEVFTTIEYTTEPKESWTEISFHPIYQNNKIIGTACNARDITAFKKNEIRIKTNEKRFRTLVESGVDSVVIFDADGTPLYVSPTIKKILGYSEQEILKIKIMSLVHDNDVERISKLWEQIIANPGVAYDSKPLRMQHKNGTWRWLEGTLTNFLNDPDIGGIVDNFRDITEIKKAKDLLLLTEFGIEKAADSIFCLDKNGKIVNVNNSACKTLGYTKEELMKLSVPDFDPIYNEKSWVKHFDELRQKGSQSLETIHKTKSGKIIPVDINANYVVFEGVEYIYSFVRDISERKKTEEKIKQSEIFNRSLIDSLRSQIVVIDEKGTIITINDAWKNFGQENSPNNLIQAIVGSNYFDVCNKAIKQGSNDARYALKGIKAVLQGSIPTFYYEYDCHTEKVKRWFAMRVVRFKGDIPMAIISHEDITDYKKTVQERDSTFKANIKMKKNEEELNKALSKEKELNELKSRFVSMASHEFRTPLTTMMSSISLVKKYAEISDQENQYKHISKIKKSITNLTDILNDFLSVSKLEEGKITVNLVEGNFKYFIEDVISEMQTIAVNQQIIKLDYTANEMIVFDRKLVEHIIMNILSNAIKFSKQGGIIDVIVKDNSDLLTITIKDYGIGISEEDQKNLFTRFFRGNNATNIQGTGLGLTIVAKYAELMKAKISLESTINVGTTFTIKIPK